MAASSNGRAVATIVSRFASDCGDARSSPFPVDDDPTMTAPDRVAPPTCSSTASPPRAAIRLLRARRGDDGHPRRAVAPRRSPPRHDPPRAGRGVHGRRPRPADRRAAVAMATLGPGATNLVTGVADAFLDRAPMVAITGQAASDKLHKEAHQVVDIVRMMEPVTKWNTRVERIGAHPGDRPQGVPGRDAGEARPDPHRAARGPRRDAPPRTTAGGPVPLAPGTAYFPEPTDEAIAHAAGLIAASERPIILAGNGVLRRGAAAELRAFARGLHVPVAATFMGKGAIDDRSHLSLMAVGLQARDHVLSGFDRADLVICVGYDLVEYAPSSWNPDGTSGSSTSTPSRPRSTPPTGPRSSSSATSTGRLRRLLAAVQPHGHRRPRRRRAARDRARSSSTPTCGRSCWPSSRRTRERRAGRSRRSGRSPTCAARSARTTSSVSDVGRAQGLGRPAVPGVRAEHGHHLQRLRGDGHRHPGRHRRRARPSRPQGRRAVRRRRLPDEQPGAGDREAGRGEHHGRHLARRRLRAHRLEAAQRVRAAVRGRVRQPGLRRLRASRSGSPGSGRERRRPLPDADAARSRSRARRSSRCRSTTPRTCG